MYGSGFGLRIQGLERRLGLEGSEFMGQAILYQRVHSGQLANFTSYDFDRYAITS